MFQALVLAVTAATTMAATFEGPDLFAFPLPPNAEFSNTTATPHAEYTSWTVDQCPPIVSYKSISLQACMRVCKITAGCTGLNFKESLQQSHVSDCDLRACPDYLLSSSEDFPNGDLPFYQAYRRVIDIDDCFDRDIKCSKMASPSVCQNSSNIQMIRNCKSSCGLCRCPEGFLNSFQCLKIYENEVHTWEESKMRCKKEGLVMPEEIDYRTFELLETGDERTFGLRSNDYWLNGRGDGTQMVLQNSKTVSNVTCECPDFALDCIPNISMVPISTSMCMASSVSPIYGSRRNSPVHCLHTYTTVCEDPSPCQFPFIFKNMWYYDCTTIDDPNGQPWCSTKTDNLNNHIMGNWRHCNLVRSKGPGNTASATPNTQDDYSFIPEDCPVNDWDECSMMCVFGGISSFSFGSSSGSSGGFGGVTDVTCSPGFGFNNHPKVRKCVRLWKKQPFRV